MNFDMFSGNNKQLVVTVLDAPNGSVVDITGATAVKWQLFHAAAASTDPVISKTLVSGITLSDPTAGQFTVLLSSTDTAGLSGKYYYEAEVTDVSSRKETVASGYITFTLKRIA
jgi:hypothetical protein